ncbi:MAG: redoxin domain-containing protein [Armatimonadetes bacterium]|nr:redoxin domain-containing protein [Armatimonadota bacterium]
MTRHSCLGTCLGLLCLVSGWTHGQAQSTDLSLKLKSLIGEYEKAQKAISANTKLSGDVQERRTKETARKFIPRFNALAQQATVSETGTDALFWVMGLGRTAEDSRAIDSALEALAQAHAASPRMAELLDTLIRDEGMRGRDIFLRVLGAVKERGANADLKSRALFHFAYQTYLKGGTEAKGKTEARGLFGELIKDYPTSKYARYAEGFIFDVENLQVGMMAPDFEATDHEGKSFKLTDYRGKVVMLEFWGFW